MDGWIELARGPLFRLSLAILVLGLAYRVASVLVMAAAAWRRAGDRDLPLRRIAATTARWLLPVRLVRARPVYSLLSVVFHVGIVALPLFLAGHVVLWQHTVPIPWPVLPPAVADVLAVAALVAVVTMLVSRAATPAARALTGWQDVAALALTGLVLGAGVLAAHPAVSPFGARGVLLVHILAGDLALVLTPFTKLVHCILLPFTRLVFELGWHFPAESGRHVAVVLSKENEPV